MAREEQERKQATDETSNNREDDETTGTDDDGKMGWMPGTALGSKAGPAPSPVQANTWGIRQERELEQRDGTWSLRGSTRCGTFRYEKLSELTQCLWQC